MDIMDIFVGQKFFKICDLESAIEKYEVENCVNLYKKDTRSISAAKKKCPKKIFSEELKYADITFACVHNGTYRSNTKTGERPNQSTIRTGCPFTIKIRSYDGQSLAVNHIGNEHNHECDRAAFNHHPSQRKLKSPELAEVQSMIRLQANKKLIRQHIQQKTNKVVLLKDIHNCTRKKLSKDAMDHELEDLKQHLLLSYPTLSMHVSHTENEVSGILFQDTLMKEHYAKYPEVLLVDATYKLNMNHMPLYAMIVIDGHLQSQCVCFFLVTSEDNTTIRDMIQIFKAHNPTWENTKIVITDKDFCERSVFKTEMPNIDLQICLFHVLRTFSREVTTTKANITTEERVRILELLEKITYAPDSAEYDKLHKELQNFGGTVKRYFDTNWHPIKEQWVQGFKSQTFNFGTSTTNRVESFFHKVKSIVSSKLTMKDLILRLMGLIDTIRKERTHREIVETTKVPTIQVNNEDDKAYRSFLTTEAYKLVQQELEKINTVNVLCDTLVESQHHHYQVQDNKCTCSFNVSRGLPCRHLMAIGRSSGLSTYLPEAVNQRWTRAYNMQADGASRAEPSSSLSVSTPKRRPMTATEKYRKASLALNAIASLMSELDTATFTQKMSQIEELLDLIKEQKDFVICEFVNQRIEDMPARPENIDGEDVVSQDMPFDDAPGGPEIDGEDVVSQDMPFDDAPGGLEENVDGEDVESAVHQDIPEEDITFRTLQLPKAKRCRGRPKGAATTAIGLPRKKARLCQGPTPFYKKDTATKRDMMLHWFLTESGIAKYRRGEQCTKDDIEQAEFVPGCSMDHMINKNIECVRDVFDVDGWRRLVNTRRDRANIPWECKECGGDLDQHASIGCDSCLSWCHMKCVRLTRAPKARHWYCMACK